MGKIETQGFFMFRRPLLSLQTLFDLHTLLASDPSQLGEQITKFYSDPLLLESIYLASPSLCEAFSFANTQKEREKLLLPLYKYLARMCTRSTPFGLFAGFFTGVIGEQTQIDFNMEDPLKINKRIEPALACKIADGCLDNNAVLFQLKFYLNSSFYETPDGYSYVERIRSDSSGKKILLTQIQKDQFFELVIKQVHQGSMLAELIGAVSQIMAASDARQMCFELLRMQFIVSELEFYVNGPPYWDFLLAKLKKMKRVEALNAMLNQINEAASSNGGLIESSKQIQLLTEHFPDFEKQTSSIQIDLGFNMNRSVLSKTKLRQLTGEFDKIKSLFVHKNKNSDLEKFKSDFFNRYENEQVPLMQAIDFESGVGYGQLAAVTAADFALLEGLDFSKTKKADRSAAAEPLLILKQKLLQRSLYERTVNVQITRQDLSDINEEGLRFGQDDFYWFGSILSSGQRAFESGDYHFYLKYVGGHSGHELLARFCYEDQPITNYVKDAIKKRQTLSPDSIYAEIAHCPDPSVAAVIAHAALYDFQIVYLSASALPFENQIHLSDLLVSVPGGKHVVLTSRKLNKQIIPRHTNAHNYASGISAYRFLCDVASQYNQGLGGWNWGSLASSSFLPRVSYNHLILSKASWNVEKSQVLSAKSGNNFTDDWKRYSEKYFIPAVFTISQTDQELIIDTRVEISMIILKNHLMRLGRIKIQEYLFDKDQGFLNSKGAHYANEVVIPFFNQQKHTKAAAVRMGSDQIRCFNMGDPWLYIKIYHSQNAADRILTEVIAPFCERLLKAKRIEKWFFIRYCDPDPHIRLRLFNGSQSGFWQNLITELSGLLKQLTQSGLVISLQTDTYQREIERYAPLAMIDVETVFFFDSMCVLGLLDLIKSAHDSDMQCWLSALLGVDLLMDDLGLSLYQKQDLMQKLANQLFEDFGLSNNLHFQIDKKYRTHKSAIYQYMNRGNQPLDDQIREKFAARSARISSLRSTSGLSVQLLPLDLVANFVHLFVNRLFMSHFKRKELIIYQYLNKFYKSSIARVNNLM